MSVAFLVGVTAKATVLWLAAWVVSRLLRSRASAAAHHLIWTLAMVGCLLLPIVTASGRAWHPGVMFPQWQPSWARPHASAADPKGGPDRSKGVAPATPRSDLAK